MFYVKNILLSIFKINFFVFYVCPGVSNELANVAYLAITSVINIVLAKNMVASAAPDSNSKFKNIS